jgi:hypothetical protein
MKNSVDVDYIAAPLGLLLFIILAITGCAATPEGETVYNPAVAKSSVQVGVMISIRKADDKQERVDKLIAGADKVLAYIDDRTTANLGTLEAVAKTAINWEDMTPDRQIEVNAIILLIKSALTNLQDDGVLTQDQLYNIRDLVIVLRDTAMLYKQ